MIYQKVKSTPKSVLVKSDALSKIILDTVSTISSAVGTTLGPGGNPVLIERFEHDLPPMITKDGVTVMRSLGFQDSTQQCILESFKDSAVRTASEAGDGTTTATILAEAFVSEIHDFCHENTRISPQKLTRELKTLFYQELKPFIESLIIKPDFDTLEGKNILKNVAKLSANGDEPLANSVMECFEIVGDSGNVTISETAGNDGYVVEKIEGYPIMMGYDDLGKYYPKFITDPSTQVCRLEKAVFLCYHGLINDIQTVTNILERFGSRWNQMLSGEVDWAPHNLVIVAIGFSEGVVANLAANFAHPSTINVYPLSIPKLSLSNGQLHILEDICAFTGATLLDPLNKQPNNADLNVLGLPVDYFEVSRYRSSIVGYASEDLIIEKVAEVEALLQNPASELDRIILQERIGKLTGGIAKLKVVGNSNGDTKERRDRAEDAVCAVRGACKYGCLPGGGWTFMQCMKKLQSLPESHARDIMYRAIEVPIKKLWSNCGMNHEEIETLGNTLIEKWKQEDPLTVYDAMENKMGNALSLGILDSAPAVLEAFKNSLSIAGVMGTLGGTVVFLRDKELERKEAMAEAEWKRNADSLGEADNRA